MTLPPPSDVICGAQITFAPARCTLPPDHSGRHLTAEIPEPLAGIVADYMLEIARLEAVRREESRHVVRLRRLTAVALSIAVAASGALIWAVTLIIRFAS